MHYCKVFLTKNSLWIKWKVFLGEGLKRSQQRRQGDPRLSYWHWYGFFWKEKVTTPHGSVSSNFLTRSTLLIWIDQYWSNQKGRTQTFSYSLFFFSYYIYSLQGKTTSPFSPLEYGKSSKFWRLRKTPKQCKSFLNSSTHFFCFVISLLVYLILFPNFLVSLPTTSFTLFHWVLKDIKNCLFVYFYTIFSPSRTADEVPT